MKNIFIQFSFMVVLSTMGIGQIGQTTLEANNFSVLVNNSGVQFNNPVLNRAGYRLKISGFSNSQSVIYSSSLWFAGKDANDQLHISANMYNLPARTFYPGPYSTNDSYSNPEYLETYNQGFNRNSIWRINRGQINAHIANFNDPDYVVPLEIQNWPAHGNPALGVAENLAPFVDVNGDGIYNPTDGDYPCVPGDENVYIIMNDRAQDTLVNQGSMGLELHQLFYQFYSFGGLQESTTYGRYQVFNRGTISYPEFRFGIFTDFDLGNPTDDFMGVEKSRNMAFVYNESNFDSTLGSSIGWSENPPAAGIMSLSSPLLSHVAINSVGSSLLPIQYWNYMNALNLDGSAFLAPTSPPPYDANTIFEPTWFLYDGNPLTGEGFSELSAENESGDRKTFMFLDSTSFLSGSSKTYDVVVLVGRGGNHMENISTLFNLADSVQLFYQNEIMNNLCAIGDASNISTNELPDFNLYPNPTQSHFFIQFQNMQPETVRVYSMTSVLVHEQTISAGENLVKIETGNLASGVYVVQVGEVIRRVLID